MRSHTRGGGIFGFLGLKVLGKVQDVKNEEERR